MMQANMKKKIIQGRIFFLLEISVIKQHKASKCINNRALTCQQILDTILKCLSYGKKWFQNFNDIAIQQNHWLKEKTFNPRNIKWKAPRQAANCFYKNKQSMERLNQDPADKLGLISSYCMFGFKGPKTL